jgi:hypothetical protein
MRSSGGWIGYAPLTRGTARYGPGEDDGGRPEMADVGRLARRLVRQVVHAARADESSIRHLLAGHLGPESAGTDMLPSGPGGATLACVQCALYLVSTGDGPLVMMVRGPEEHSPVENVTVEVTCADHDRAQQVVDEIRRLAISRNVFRGHVIEFGERCSATAAVRCSASWTARRSAGTG